MFHAFVRECLVSVIENRFHVFKNKKKEPNLFLTPCSLLFFFFFHNKNQFLNRFHVFVRECLVSVIGVVIFKQLVFGEVWKNSYTLSLILKIFLFIICLRIVAFTYPLFWYMTILKAFSWPSIALFLIWKMGLKEF